MKTSTHNYQTCAVRSPLPLLFVRAGRFGLWVVLALLKRLPSTGRVSAMVSALRSRVFARMASGCSELRTYEGLSGFGLEGCSCSSSKAATISFTRMNDAIKF